MFNTTNMRLGSNSQSVQLNAPSTGILQRSNPKSIFIRFKIGSDMEKMVFPHDGTNPYIFMCEHFTDKYNSYKETKGRIEVIVLQILIFGQDQYLVEVVEPKHLIETAS